MARRPHAVLALVAAFACMAADWPVRQRDWSAEASAAPPGQRAQLVLEAAASGGPRAESVVVGALDDGDAGVRATAARMVARERYASASSRMREWLSDPQTETRLAAARALGALGDRSAVPSLVRALGDPVADVRVAAIGALRAIRDPVALGPLLDRLGDAEGSVRTAAANALGVLGDPRAVLSLLGILQDSIPEVRAATVAALGQLHDVRAQRGLLSLVRDPQREVRVAAVRALGRLGSPDIAPDLAALVPARDPADPADRALAIAAVESLGRIGGAEARAVLLHTIGGWLPRDVVLSALVATGPSLVPELTRMVLAGRPSPSATRSFGQDSVVVELLGTFGGDQATDALASAYANDRSSPGARDLLRALGATRSPRAVPSLLSSLTSVTAVLAPDSAAAPAWPRDHRDTIIESLVRIARANRGLDPASLDPVSAALRATMELPHRQARDEQAIVPLIELLGHTRNPRAGAILAPLLDATGSSVRATVARALASVSLAGVSARVVTALEDPDPDVRFAASDALALQGDRVALAALVSRWNDPRPMDRTVALRALVRLAVRCSDVAAADLVLEPAGPLAAIESAERIDAWSVLASSGNGRAVSLLLDALHSSPSDRLAALEAMGNALARAPETQRLRLSRALEAVAFAPEADPRERATALWALGHSTDVALEARFAAALELPGAASVANAAGALAQRYSAGVVPSEDAGTAAALCSVLHGRRHAVLRANVLQALAAGQLRCAHADDTRRALTDGRSTAVRRAAVSALLVWARVQDGADEPTVARRELQRCADSDRDPDVERFCRRSVAALTPSSAAPSAAPALDGAIDPAGVDVFLVREDGTPEGRGTAYVLEYESGVARMGWLGASGWLHDRPSPRGTYTLREASDYAPEP